MASNSRSSGTAAFRYASALVDLAMEQNATAQIERDVADLSAMVSASSDFQTLIRSPLIGASDAGKALAAIADAAKLHALTKNFLLTLAKNGRLSQLEAVLKAVSDALSSRRGEVRAKVEAASELSDSQKKSLEQGLSKSIGRPVAIDAKVNKDLIGGLVVTLGSFMIDDSVKSKLDRLGRAMKQDSSKAA